MLISSSIWKEKGCDPLNRILHTHRNNFEIIYIHSGSGSFTVGERSFGIYPDSLLFIDSDRKHCCDACEQPTYIRSKIMVNKEQLLSLLMMCNFSIGLLNTTCFYLNSIQSETVRHEIEKICECDMKERSLPIVGIINILQQCDEAASLDGKNTISDRVITFINNNINSRLSLHFIAKSLYISDSHLCHVFRDETGFSPMEYVRRRRISKAQQMLISTNIPVSQICMECGFESFSYFSRMFREVCGTSPSEYRKNPQIHKESIELNLV